MPQPSQQERISRPQRINRILSLAGLTSRRKADDWIKSGRVEVNGEIVLEPGTKAFWGSDRIRVDGRDIPGPSERIYLMINKPFGYVCSLDDPQGRPVVTELLKTVPQRVYPVGRLDFDSLGLLLMTNDGEWAYRLTHPRYGVPRTYKVTVAGEVGDAPLQALQRGVSLDDGTTARARVKVLSRNPDRTVLRVGITQGKSRQVRRMFEAVGRDVIHLMRTAFGNLFLGDLKVGEFRSLDRKEVEALKKLVGLP
jgi:23S rRNA pseudouridine2605 synthase